MSLKRLLSGTVIAAAMTLGSAAPAFAGTTVPDAVEDAVDSGDDGSDKTGLWGLLGLAGLAGLAGLKRRDRNDATTVRRNTGATTAR